MKDEQSASANYTHVASVCNGFQPPCLGMGQGAPDWSDPGPRRTNGGSDPARDGTLQRPAVSEVSSRPQSRHMVEPSPESDSAAVAGVAVCAREGPSSDRNR